jgi:hypothetical protein
VKKVNSSNMLEAATAVTKMVISEAFSKRGP